MKFKRIRRVFIAHNTEVRPVVGVTADRTLFINIPYENKAKRQLIRGDR